MLSNATNQPKSTVELGYNHYPIYFHLTDYVYFTQEEVHFLTCRQPTRQEVFW